MIILPVNQINNIVIKAGSKVPETLYGSSLILPIVSGEDEEFGIIILINSGTQPQRLHDSPFFPIAKQSSPSQICTQACLTPGALEWQFQVESWEFGSITVLERTFLENVVPLLGSCFLVFYKVTEPAPFPTIPHCVSRFISVYLWGVCT